MGNVKVEAKHYEQAIRQVRSDTLCIQRSSQDVCNEVTKRARELAHAEQENQK